MLSQDLLSLQIWFDNCRTGQHEMTAEGAEHFSRAIGACFAQAVAMECAPLGGIGSARLGERQPDFEEFMRIARAMADATNVVLLHTQRPPFDDAPRGGSAA